MKTTYYVPIYEWGDDPTNVCGTASGTRMYQSLQDLYGFEGEFIVGYYEVSGIFPTKQEFEEQQGIVSSGAV